MHQKEHAYISWEVEASLSTSGENRNKTREILQKTEQICKNLEASGHQEKAQQIRKECEDVRLATFGSLKEENFTTQSLLWDLRNELKNNLKTQPQDLRNGQIIDSEMSAIEQEYNELEALQDTPEGNRFAEMFPQYTEYSPEEAKMELDRIWKIYNTLPDGTLAEKALSYMANSLILDTKEIKSTTTANLAQEVLIDKIYGNGTTERWFSGENLVGFATDEGGNYIISVSEFEQKLQNGDDINPKIFASYVAYLEAKYWLESENFKMQLSKVMGTRKDTIDVFLNSSNDETVQKIKTKLIQVWIFSQEQGLIDWFYAWLKNQLDTTLIQLRNQAYGKDVPIDTFSDTYMIFQQINTEIKTERPKAYLEFPDAKIFLKENIKALVRSTENEDISKAKNPEVKSAIIDERKKVLITENESLKKNIKQNILPQFWNAPEIQTIISAYFNSSEPINISDITYDLQIATLRFNKLNPEKAIFMEASKIVSLLEKVELGKSLDVQASLIENQQTFSLLIKEALEISQQIEQKREQHRGIIASQHALRNKGVLSPEDQKNLKKYNNQLIDLWADIDTISTEHKKITSKLHTENNAISRKKRLLARWRLNSALLQETKKELDEIVTWGISKNKGQTSWVQEFPEYAPIIEEWSKIQNGYEQFFRAKEKAKNSQRITNTQKKLQKENDALLKEYTDISQMIEQWNYTVLEEVSEKQMLLYAGADWKKDTKAATEKYKEKGKSSIKEKHSWEDTSLWNHVLSSQNESPEIPNWVVREWWNGAEIVTDTGKIFPISREEQQIITESPQALPNIISFHTFFDDCNLSWVSEYIPELVKAMGNMNINLDGDAINQRELIAFGNQFIKILNTLRQGTGEPELHTNHQTIFSLKADLRQFSEAGQFMGENKTFNNYGEDKFISLMRSYGFIGGVLFQTAALRDAMNGKSVEPLQNK